MPFKEWSLALAYTLCYVSRLLFSVPYVCYAATEFKIRKIKYLDKWPNTCSSIWPFTKLFCPKQMFIKQ